MTVFLRSSSSSPFPKGLHSVEKGKVRDKGVGITCCFVSVYFLIPNARHCSVFRLGHLPFHRLTTHNDKDYE